MPRKSDGDGPMSGAKRQALHRAKRAAGLTPARTRAPADRRSRAQRWRDAVTVLLELQTAYQTWLDGMPAMLRQSATGHALQAITRLDLSVLLSVEPPRGWGRDRANHRPEGSDLKSGPS